MTDSPATSLPIGSDAPLTLHPETRVNRFQPEIVKDVIDSLKEEIDENVNVVRNNLSTLLIRRCATDVSLQLHVAAHAQLRKDHANSSKSNKPERQMDSMALAEEVYKERIAIHRIRNELSAIDDLIKDNLRSMFFASTPPPEKASLENQLQELQAHADKNAENQAGAVRREREE